VRCQLVLSCDNLLNIPKDNRTSEEYFFCARNLCIEAASVFSFCTRAGWVRVKCEDDGDDDGVVVNFYGHISALYPL
jgi:hypothetical protein